ncbi:HSF5 protein, partial [Emberiza fucata]|nr:HSF5 protein [Emberiza fucata]
PVGLKLWRLVNSPCIRSVRWDSRAQGLPIDLLERELLSLGHAHRGHADGPAPVPHTFRATQFRSFVWQLYRYGFRKVPGWVSSAAPGDAGAWLHYNHPCFHHDLPDLLLRIKCRSVANRQLPVAGREGRRRPPRRRPP